jgi:hypothetical protein
MLLKPVSGFWFLVSGFLFFVSGSLGQRELLSAGISVGQSMVLVGSVEFTSYLNIQSMVPLTHQAYLRHASQSCSLYATDEMSRWDMELEHAILFIYQF